MSAVDGTLARSKKVLNRAADLLPVRVVRAFMDHRGGSMAVLIAWNAMVSLFPIALALAAVIGLVLSVAGFTTDAIAQTALSLFPEDIGAQQATLHAIDVVMRQTGVFVIAAFIGFLWTGANLFGAMEEAFAVIFRTPTRPFLRQKLMALGMMGLFAVLTVIAVGTSALLGFLSEIPGQPVSLTRGPVGYAIQVAVGTVAGFLLFFAIYYVVPNRRQKPSRVWPGALFAGVCFEALTLLFPFYLRLDPTINRYGRDFALLFILVAFFYFLGVITVLGAEVIAALDPPNGAEQPA